MKRIVLFGYRGTGKTAIGTLLARKIGVPFADTDTLIEAKAGRTVAAIFHDDGEEVFRALERDTIAALPASDIVAGTGGGAVIDPANMACLRKESVCVLL
ncbi:MAG: shikimate kinase, partial [Methanoregula sp.]